MRQSIDGYSAGNDPFRVTARFLYRIFEVRRAARGTHPFVVIANDPRTVHPTDAVAARRSYDAVAMLEARRRAATSDGVHARFIDIDDLTDAQLARWRELAEQAVEPNPFFEPECVLPAARHLGDANASLLVVQARDGAWIGCLPVRRGLRYRRVSMPLLSSWRFLYAPLGTPLVSRLAVAEAVDALVDETLGASRVGVVALPWVGADGPVQSALRDALAARRLRPAVERSFERAIMRRPTLEDGAEALLARGHRRDLARLARRLAEQLGAPVELRDESEDASVVERFLAVEASGWKGERGTALASSDAHGAFFRELCDGFRAAGRLQILTLGTETQHVSYKCNLLAGDAVFCFKIAFDETFGRFRPGLQLELKMLERFRDDMSQEWMDSCADENSKLFEHFWPERRRITSYVIASHAPARWAIGRLAS